MTRFANGTLVKIHSTNSRELDGQVVRVTGIAQEVAQPGEFGTIYIVQKGPGEPFSTGYSCIALTEACLEKVSRSLVSES